MSIRVTCPGCQAAYNVPEAMQGKEVRCRKCQQQFCVSAVAAPWWQEEVLPEVVPVDDPPIPRTGVQTRPAAVPPPPPPPRKTRATPLPAKAAAPSRRPVVLLSAAVAGSLLLLVVAGLVAAKLLWPSNSQPVASAPAVDAAEVKGANAEGQPEAAAEAAAPPPVQGIKPPALDQDKVVRPLPGAVGDVAVGGGGRFLIVHLPAVRKLAIFDVNEAKVVHYLSLAEDDVKFTAGLDKLMILLPDKGIIQRWSLRSFERELSVSMPIPGVKGILMGSNSRGPLWAGDGFLDIETLKPLSIVAGEGRGFGVRRGLGDATYARISADGRVVGCWAADVSPQGIQTLVLTGNQLKSYYEHDSAGHIIPGPDGKIIYTSRGLFTSEAKPLGQRDLNRAAWFLPALHGDYYLTIFSDDRFGLRGIRNQEEKLKLSLHLASDSRPLLTLTDVELPQGINQWDREKLGMDKRIHFIPDAKVIVTIPTTNDKLVVQRLDVEEALEKSGIDYLLVTSRPPVSAGKGQTYSYQLAVKSKKGGLKYKLDSGPKDMKLSPSGRVSWPVPADVVDADVDVLISVSDSAGQEVFHTYKIKIEGALAANGEDKRVAAKEPAPADRAEAKPKAADAKVERPAPPAAAEKPKAEPAAPVAAEKPKAAEIKPAEPAEPKQPPRAVRGQLAPEILKDLKAATVFIKVEAPNFPPCSGSGFLVKVVADTGYLVTNHHVVNPEAELLTVNRTGPSRAVRVIKSVPKNVVVNAVFQSGTKAERSVRAEILSTDSSRDLAVLRIKDFPNLPRPIDLEQKVQLIETMPTYTLGFPFGQALALNNSNPAITISKGSVSSLRENEFGQMKAVQIDGAINPGNSGGPVVDEEGRLVGVAVATIRGAGIGLAIAPDELARMFQGRVGGVDLRPQRVDARTAACDVDMQLIDPLNQIKSAALLYGLGSAAPAKLPQNPDGSFDPAPRMQRLDLKIADQKASGQLKLTLTPSDNFLIFQALYVNGSGKTVHTQVGGQLIPAAQVAAQAPPAPLVVPNKPDNAQPAPRPEGSLLRAAPPALPFKPAPLQAAKITLPLPGSIQECCVGGGGRFLIFHLPQQRQLAIFDANEAKIVKYLSVTEDKVLFVAGMDKLVVIFPDKNIIQRWSLLSFERELATTFAAKARVFTAVMGSASAGPIALGGPQLNGYGGLPIQFIDVQTLKDVNFKREGSGHVGTHPQYPAQMRCSPDGRVLGMWNPGLSPSGLQSVVLEGGGVKTYSEHTSVGHIIPGPDGRTLFTAAGLYTAEVKKVGNDTLRPATFPAVHGNYYLSLPNLTAMMIRDRNSPKAQLTVNLLGDTRPLTTLTDLEGFDLPDIFNRNAAAMPLDKRMFLIPAAKLLVLIPTTADRLVVHRFDVEETLEKSDIDYLLVTSPPLTKARKGQAYAYQLTVKAKKGGIKYKIDSGPKGMKITATGQLTWQVPADVADRDVDVILSVADAAGQEVFQTFKISIE